MKTKVTLQEIEDIIKRRNRINILDLDDIEFIDFDGKVVDIPQGIIDKFKFVGLSNIDFITSNYYKRGQSDKITEFIITKKNK